jgi:hypothetical protein
MSLINSRMVNRVACVLVLAAACGDDRGTGDTGTGTGSSTTTTSPTLPTTGNSTSGDDASGTGSATGTSSDSATPTTSPISGDPSTGTETTLSGTTTIDASTSDTGMSSADTGTSTGADTSTSTSADTTDTDSSTTGGCQSPDECPAPPGECVVAICEAGSCGAGLAPAGTPCQTGVCTDDGMCVECNLDADCPGEVCVNNACTAPPPSCNDGVKNGSETAVDCGGSCPGCDDGDPCLVDGDCLSDLCTAKICTPQPTCSDNLKNGGETDIDCGGNTCAACQNGDMCLVNADCQSALCTNNICTPQPTCDDNLKNGGETDIDCGGQTCAACQNGDTCFVNSDCQSALCQNGTCTAQPTCNDNLKNGSETDIDCGGSCPDCPDGDTCLVNADCQSATCTNGTCTQAAPMCTQMAPDPATGQRCPLFMDCTQSSECGLLQGCQQWFCNPSKTCELNALVSCWQDVGGQCNADVVFTQQTLPPVAKRFVPPDGVDFREVASLVFTVKNNSANDLYLDKLPLVLDVMGGGSKFDVSSVKIFDNSGGSEHGGGDLLVCLTADPFSFPANGTMGPCAGSAFSRVPKSGGTNQFLVNVAFAANKTFIAGRSYRLRLASTAGVQFKVGFNGPLFAGTMCGVPNEGYTGAWVTAQNP